MGTENNAGKYRGYNDRNNDRNNTLSVGTKSLLPISIVWYDSG